MKLVDKRTGAASPLRVHIVAIFASVHCWNNRSWKPFVTCWIIYFLSLSLSLSLFSKLEYISAVTGRPRPGHSANDQSVCPSWRRSPTRRGGSWPDLINLLNPELNPICYLLALLGAHHFIHVTRIRVKLLTFRLLMSYIYIYEAPILDVSRSHTTTQHSR